MGAPSITIPPVLRATPPPATPRVCGNWRYPARAGPSMGPVYPGPHAPGPRTARGGPMPGSSPYSVVVIGAGFGGIGMGIALRRAGIEDFLVVDKGDGPGGTWRDNTYPGAACDVPAHLYSFSFRPGRWRGRFPPQRETLAYLCDLAEAHGLGPHLR